MVQSSTHPLPSHQYSRESLAGLFEISPRRISYWVNMGLLSPARGKPGSSPRSRYFDDGHVREIRALLAVRDNNTRDHELGSFLREEGMTILQYARERNLMIA